MALTRANLLTYAAEEFEELATLAGVAATDTAAGHKYPIDFTLLRLGHADTALATAEVSSADAEAAYALLDYYELLRFSKKLSNRRDADVSGAGGVSFKRRTERNQLREDLQDAATRCAMLGYSVTGGVWEVGALTLDFLEPSAV